MSSSSGSGIHRPTRDRDRDHDPETLISIRPHPPSPQGQWHEMADRRERQRLFEQRRQRETEEVVSATTSDREREVTITTYGSRRRSGPDTQTNQRNFDVSNVPLKVDPRCLTTLTGKDPEIRDLVARTPRFRRFVCGVVRAIERDNLTEVSINCHQGRHRSVAVAEILRDTYYPRAKVRHMELGTA